MRRVDAGSADAADALAALLADAVEGGASVGFVLPLPDDQARSWAEATVAAIGPGLVAWLAEVDDRVVGTVQLAPCLKPNGRHRGEVMKLLVRRDARGAGVASALLGAVDDHARSIGLTLLVLDTEAGSDAESVYRHLGWQRAGAIPDYAVTPHHVMHPTVVYFRRLGI